MTFLSPVRFRVVIAVMLATAFLLLQFLLPADTPSTAQGDPQGAPLQVFFHPECPHCHDAIEFLRSQQTVRYQLHDVSTASGERLLLDFAGKHGIAEDQLGVPLFVCGSNYLIGYESAETTGRALLSCRAGNPSAEGLPADPSRVHVPLIGEIDPSRYSLLALTALMGLSDGFNPCAMWVLLYLISLIAGLQDRRKIWWLVGTFVLSSGLLYFLFMTAWLNTFLFIGYTKILTELIALVAIGCGADHLYQLAVSRGVIVCEVGDAAQRQRTLERARALVAAPVGVASLVMIVGLALTVNAIEFVCSAALPAIYTHILSLLDLPALQYYGYIGLYVAFFMLDDLIIFGLAAFAVQKVIDTRYAAFSRAVGGVMLIGLGIWMLLR
ncbi:MAG: hypothetical protein K0M49_19095 [Arenimonas sp.]|nr:hypothetical protein [Arenimonas sp.]